MEDLTKCPVCEETVFTPYLDCVDHSISNERFSLQKCVHCSFVFTNPRPDPQQIGKYYKSDVYISHHANKSGIIPRVYRFIRDRQFVTKVNLIKTYINEPLSILDIGCGTGDFLNYCKSIGWHTKGVEPDGDAALQAKQKGIEVYDTGYLNNPTLRADVITMWHVLEHVHSLNERLDQLNRLINPGGIIVVAVPNILAKDAKKYGPFWAAYDVPRHLSHFTRKTISSLFLKKGFTLCGVYPMKYDAFYVSIKSEEYKHKAPFVNLIKGVAQGFLSNYAASGTGEYSSLIYVFKK